jgi:Baseplate J-like protein
MGLPTSALATIVSYARAFFRTSFVGFPMGVKQFFGLVARALGLTAWSVQKSIEDLDVDIVPNPNSSTESLDQWAFTTGLPNGDDGYGRLVPQPATGGLASPTGVLGTTFPDGRQALAEDGTTIVKVSGSQTIPGGPGGGSGDVQVNIVAVTVGSVGNLPAGTVCTWQSPPPGADPTFVLTSDLTGGIDTETNAGVYGRLVLQGQTPPVGGNSTDITDWAEEGGAVGVYVYPKRSGAGTVDVVITGGGSGAGRVPSASVQAAVRAVMNANSAPGVEAINVLLPSLAANGHLVRVRVVPNGTLNAFDWNDTVGGPFTVAAYTPGTSPTLKLNTLAPASLQAAIDSFNAGTSKIAPRLQVLSTGATAVNPPVSVVGHSEAAGQSTLTLASVTSGWQAPTTGDTLYAYGPVVATIAAAVSSLCDALGPSTKSGYASTTIPWNDTLALNQIIRVAEDATDSNGAVLVTEVLSGGATIDGATTDVEGSDNGIVPPELLYLSHVAVTA